MLPIGRLLFEEACRQARRWRERPPDGEVLLCVNVSASQFAYQADLIPKLLSDAGLDPEGLRLEITEQAVMDDAEFSIGKLQRLKALGISFAIDDYGTGYSCPNYLKRMPVDAPKIDGSSVAGLGKDQGDDAIISSTIDLAHALGLKVVAEGVETAGQFARLQELNCDLTQGYYFCEPIPVREASDLLTNDHRWWLQGFRSIPGSRFVEQPHRSSQRYYAPWPFVLGRTRYLCASSRKPG